MFLGTAITAIPTAFLVVVSVVTVFVALEFGFFARVLVVQAVTTGA